MSTRGLLPILICVALLALVPLVITSNVVLNFLVVALLIAVVGQGWNVLGGYGGQYSFGHAAFFGTGAYVTAILQVHYGVNAWIGFLIGIAAGALVGTIIGALAFRSGLRGSYFALVTLAFAEVLRILASVAPITGAGVGTLIPLNLRPEVFQFQSRAPFYWIALALVAISLLIVHLIEQSRFGAYLVAVRENEDAAKALGINPLAVKLLAMTISAAMTAAGGCFYAQYFLFVDSGIAYGAVDLDRSTAGARHRRSRYSIRSAARRAGSARRRRSREARRRRCARPRSRDLWMRADPGDRVCGARNRRDCSTDLRDTMQRLSARKVSADGARRMADALLTVEGISKRFGGLAALSDASLSAETGRITALIGPNGAGKTTLFAAIAGFLRPDRGRVLYAGNEITGEPPYKLARRGIARTFQIVQPFAGLTVRENIAVGAHLSRPARARRAGGGGRGRARGRARRSARQIGREPHGGRAQAVGARARTGTGPKLLLLDEVLAGLNPSEIRDMVPVISAIRARGVTILMIEHVMQAVMSLAEQVWVLAEGRIIAQGAPREIAGNPQRGRGLPGPWRGEPSCRRGRWCPVTRCLR